MVANIKITLYLIYCNLRVTRILFCLFSVFVAKEGDGLGDKGSGDTTTVDAETFLEACGHIPQICLFP